MATVDWVWKYSEYIAWAKNKSTEEEKNKFNFDITKADKIFDYLLEKGQIKLSGNHRIPSAEELKKKRYCKYQNYNTHNTNDCKVFRDIIQQAINKGKIGLEKTKGGVGIEGHPFPANMVSSSFPKGKFKVLTSKRAKETKVVDSTRQISTTEYQKMKEKQDRQISQISRSDIPETSKSGETRRRRTIKILLNKWQRQKEKEQMCKEGDHWRYQEEIERRIQEENEYHWNCPFFQHCWNEGLKLPTLNNCPECSDQYWEYREAKVNHRPVHEILNFERTSRHVKIENIHDRLKKEIVDMEYVWLLNQCCPGGLTRS